MRCSSLDSESTGVSSWQIQLLTDWTSSLPQLSSLISWDNFYSPFYRYSSQLGFSSGLSSIPSRTLDRILEPIDSNSTVFQVWTSPLLNPILTAEMKNYLASLQPSSNFPVISSVLIRPSRPALFTTSPNSSIISSYYKILNLRLIVIPAAIAFK